MCPGSPATWQPHICIHICVHIASSAPSPSSTTSCKLEVKLLWNYSEEDLKLADVVLFLLASATSNRLSRCFRGKVHLALLRLPLLTQEHPRVSARGGPWPIHYPVLVTLENKPVGRAWLASVLRGFKSLFALSDSYLHLLPSFCATDKKKMNLYMSCNWV